MNAANNGSVLSSEDIKKLMLNMEKEQEILDSARIPLLVLLTDLKNSTLFYDRLGDVAAKSLIFKHNHILFPIIEANAGTVIKTTGDGVLAVFNDAEAGVKAAAEIQRSLAEYNLNQEAETTITIRIGLHYGKTIVFENDVYGDSINATSRIEALAEGEEILLSETVVQAARIPENQLVNLGPVHLKGKLEPVNVYGLLWDTSNSKLLKRYQEKKELLSQQAKNGSSGSGIRIKGLPDEVEFVTDKHSKPANPFLNRSAITQPDYFCGREVLIHKIYSRLSASRPQSVSLYGERRIGKSSLLNQLRSYQTSHRYLSENQHYIYIIIDIQSMRSATVEHFIETLYEGVRIAFSDNISFDLKPDYHDFTRLVSELNAAGFVMIVMLDEFDLITLNPNFDVEFYSWLRSLASHYQLAFVTSSLCQLQQLCATKKISDSPFFNIFTAFYVGPFSVGEAELMIRTLLKLSLTDYSFEEWLPEIFDKAGYLPFFIQIYCSNLYDLYPHNPDPAEVEAAYLEEAADHFEHICRNLGREEIECFKLLQTGHKIPARLESTLQALERKGYVKLCAEKRSVFSSTFGSYLSRHETNHNHKTLWSKLWRR